LPLDSGFDVTPAILLVAFHPVGLESLAGPSSVVCGKSLTVLDVLANQIYDPDILSGKPSRQWQLLTFDGSVDAARFTIQQFGQSAFCDEVTGV